MLPRPGWYRSMVGLLAVGLIAPIIGGTNASASPPVAVSQEFPNSTADKDLPFGATWGSGLSGQIGNGDPSSQSTPVLVDGGGVLAGKEVSVLEAGSSRTTCGLADSIAYCWGDNAEGTLGNNGAPADSSIPVAVQGPFKGKRISAVSVGRKHACGILDGAAYCWGDNSTGQLGNNLAPTDSALPVAVLDEQNLLAGQTVTAISAGDDHTCAIASGKAYCWGANDRGQLGNNSKLPSNKPVAVFAVAGPFLNKVITSIAVADRHSCALTEGRVYCWGANSAGQLGLNHQMDRSKPTAVVTDGQLADRTITALAVGGNVSCVLGVLGGSSNRKAYCWGSGNNYALGNGLVGNSLEPRAVAVPAELNGVSISSISVGSFGGCLVAVGKAYCWGSNASGRLGNGADKGTSENAAVAVVRPVGVTDKRRFLTISASAAASAGVVVTTPSFSDVSSKQPFQDDIKWLAGSGIAQGFADGKFQPGSKISRQAMAAFLFRFKNPGIAVPKCTGQTRKFIDVPATNTQFCGAIEWLVTAKITKVPANGKFNPSGAMLRDTMAAFLFRAHHPNVTDQKCAPGPRLFVDVPATNTQCGNIEWLAKTGVSTGFDGGTYQPKDVVTRASMSAFIHRAAELNAH